MTYLSGLVSSDAMYALGWTLLHSLWQASAIAILLAILMIGLRRYSSNVRYVVSTIALVAVLVLSAITFVRLKQAGYETAASRLAMIETSADGAGVTAADETLLERGLAIAGAYVDENIQLIVTVWIIGVIVLLLKLLGGLAYLQRQKHVGVTPLPEKWQRRVQEIGQSIGMDRPVRLMESVLAKAPSVIGHFKPVILLPLGVMTGLTEQQVEAILAHELAHIMRRDYLVNMLQSVVDVIFFYNPAVWWISATIRAEREHYCDDVAVSLTVDSMVLAKALASVCEIADGTTNLAVAASGQKGFLMRRIRRILLGKTDNPTSAQGLVAAGIVVAGIFAVLVGADAATHPAEEELPRISSVDAGIVDPEELKKQDVKAHGAEKRVAKEKPKWKASELPAAAKKETQRLKNEMVAVEDMIEWMRQDLNKTKEKQALKKKELEKLKQNYEKTKQKLEQLKNDPKAEKKKRKEIEKKLEQVKLEAKKVKEATVRIEAELAKTRQVMKQAEKEQEGLRKAIESSQKKSEQSEWEKKITHKVMTAVVKELERDKLIGKDDKSWEFYISPKAIEVNGKPRDKKTYKKYRRVIEKIAEMSLEKFAGQGFAYIMKPDGRAKIKRK